jgi:hypothetical protein
MNKRALSAEERPLRGETSMTRPTLLSAIAEALRNAGAPKEIIAAAVKAGGERVGNRVGNRELPTRAASMRAVWRAKRPIVIKSIT